MRIRRDTVNARRTAYLLAVAAFAGALGVWGWQWERRRHAPGVDEDGQLKRTHAIVGWGEVEDLSGPAVFQSIFWDPRDTTTFRALLRDSPMVAGKEVLEIGTGSGLLGVLLKRSQEIFQDVMVRSGRVIAFFSAR